MDNSADNSEDVALDDSGAEPGAVRAAGAVLWRDHDGERTEIALVHRPRYDDWSLPKGKLDGDETSPQAAAREVTEETGFPCTLSRFLDSVRYPVGTRHGPAIKHVDYFAARAGDGHFVPNSEVDDLRWLDIDAAYRELSYDHDARVLDAFRRLPTNVVTLLLVRHAEAGSRGDWHGDDDRRPLNETGMRQRAVLRSLLPLFGPQRLLSAPRLRCEQTIAPVADDLGLPIAGEALLSEEDYARDPQAAVDRLLHIAAEPGTAAVCTQGRVIPDLLSRLAEYGNLALGATPCEKGSMWTLTFRQASDAEHNTPRLLLAAADYLPNPIRGAGNNGVSRN